MRVPGYRSAASGRLWLGATCALALAGLLNLARHGSQEGGSEGLGAVQPLREPCAAPRLQDWRWERWRARARVLLGGVRVTVNTSRKAAGGLPNFSTRFDRIIHTSLVMSPTNRF